MLDHSHAVPGGEGSSIETARLSGLDGLDWHESIHTSVRAPSKTDVFWMNQGDDVARIWWIVNRMTWYHIDWSGRLKDIRTIEQSKATQHDCKNKVQDGITNQG